MARPRKQGPLLEQMIQDGHHRMFERKSTELEVILEDEFGEPLLCVPARDLSRGGVYLCTFIPMRIGSHALLRFVLPDNNKFIRLVGEVVRVDRDSKEHSIGLGLRFVEVESEIRHAIDGWVGAA